MDSFTWNSSTLAFALSRVPRHKDSYLVTSDGPLAINSRIAGEGVPAFGDNLGKKDIRAVIAYVSAGLPQRSHEQ